MPHRTFLCRIIFCAVFSVSIINVFNQASAPSFFLRYSKSAAFLRDHAHCPQSDIAHDVLVVLRTGATESRAKLPVHFGTTLRCVPNYVLFSDLDEEVEGHAVHDVLSGVTEKTQKDHPDFKLYHQLHHAGRDGALAQKVLTHTSGSAKGDYLNTENNGWKLDKWKFLPMVDQAFKHSPSAKWYVFIETDTFMAWNNLLEYLSNFDPSKPYYIGKHLYINDIEFGYGGAGFILSNPAIRKVSEHRSTRINDYEDFTATHWVGDCALGKILEDVKVPLHKAYPHLQGDSPATMDPAVSKLDRNAWCYPAITYHHVSPSEIQDLWVFEQDWFKRHDHLLRHRDIFMHHVRPKIAPSLVEWDNLADQEFNAHDHGNHTNPLEAQAWKSFHHCHDLCESRKDCIQFKYDPGSCFTSTSFRWGYAKPKERVKSGWMLDRVDDLFLQLESRCGIRDWFGPQEGAVFKKRR